MLFVNGACGLTAEQCLEVIRLNCGDYAVTLLLLLDRRVSHGNMVGCLAATVWEIAVCR